MERHAQVYHARRVTCGGGGRSAVMRVEVRHGKVYGWAKGLYGRGLQVVCYRDYRCALCPAGCGSGAGVMGC